jgi:hypothetical protein
MIKKPIEPPARCPVCLEAASFQYLEDHIDSTYGGRYGERWSLYECSACAIHFFSPFKQIKFEELSHETDNSQRKGMSFFFDRLRPRPWNFTLFLKEKPIFFSRVDVSIIFIIDPQRIQEDHLRLRNFLHL